MEKVEKTTTVVENAVEEIISDVGIKAAISSAIVKWGIGIAITLIGGAFGYGGYLATKAYNNNEIRETLISNTQVINELKQTTTDGFKNVNQRIDKIYTDGFKEFSDFQDYNKKQFELVIDYGNTNKELLKKMLELNTISKTKDMENKVEEAKINIPEVLQSKTKDYISIMYIVSRSGKDTTVQLTGATKEYIDKIDKKLYRIGAIINNKDYPNLYNLNYTHK